MNIHGSFKYTLDLDKQDEYGCFTATIKTERKSYTGQSRKPAIAIAYALEEAAKDLHEAQRILDDLDRLAEPLIDSFNKHTNVMPRHPSMPTGPTKVGP